jgi:phosphonopyruvate decarboxylase
MVGWRGRPGIKDEPQHVKMGRINEAMIKSLEIPYCILSNDFTKAAAQIDVAYTYMTTNNAPYILLVEKGTFEGYKLQSAKADLLPMSREKALEIILNQLSDQDVIVSTTGKTSREVFEVRETRKEPHFRDFLCVGNMGHTSQIALGIALSKPDRRVVCIDGDGSFLMHMGSTAINGSQDVKNLKHILINNGAHESVGGQPTVGFFTDFKKIALACNYNAAFSCDSEDELSKVIGEFLSSEGPSLLEVNVKKGSREDLGRPTIKPEDNKIAFMNNLKD